MEGLEGNLWNLILINGIVGEKWLIHKHHRNEGRGLELSSYREHRRREFQADFIVSKLSEYRSCLQKRSKILELDKEHGGGKERRIKVMEFQFFYQASTTCFFLIKLPSLYISGLLTPVNYLTLIYFFKKKGNKIGVSVSIRIDMIEYVVSILHVMFYWIF